MIVVDDEPTTRSLFAKTLIADGHAVRTASDVFACRAALKAEAADLILLDLGLPGVDGLVFAREARNLGDIGIIVVTSRDDARSRIAALDRGADDYLIKPVHLGELAARVRSLLRRRRRVEGHRFRLSNWTVDLTRRGVFDSAGAAVDLTRGEFELLARLVEADGKIVSRDRLSEAINRGEREGDLRSVDALVSRLRRKLPLPAGADGLIVTAPGFGYRLGVAASSI